jgi:hypothetical protein
MSYTDPIIIDSDDENEKDVNVSEDVIDKSLRCFWPSQSLLIAASLSKKIKKDKSVLMQMIEKDQVWLFFLY